MMARRIVTGLMLCIAGLVFAGVGFLIWQAAQDKEAALEANYRRADIVCRESVQKLGAIDDARDGAVWSVRVPVVGDSRGMLGDASIAIAACPTRSLEYFCMGPGCLEGPAKPATATRRPVGMSMKLALKPSVPVSASASAASVVGAGAAAPRPPVAQPPRPQPPRPSAPPAAGQSPRPSLPVQPGAQK